MVPTSAVRGRSLVVPAGVLLRDSGLSDWLPPVKVISVLSGLNQDSIMFFHVSVGRENTMMSLRENP